ncbi:MAG: GbsR/MarR family transcriptional regulator [Planctomycetota bacterium]
MATARRRKPESDATAPPAPLAVPEGSAGTHALSRPAGADALTQRVLDVCDRVGAFVEYWGFKAIHGRIWTLLALHRGPLHQGAITELLGVSKSLVSTAVSELVNYGLIRQVEDHRNAPYEASMDIWPVVSDVLRSREWMMLESTRMALEAAMEQAEVDEKRPATADDGDAAGTVDGKPRFDPKRMQLLLSMTESAQAMLKMLIGIRVPRALAGLAGWVGRLSSLIGRMRTAE